MATTRCGWTGTCLALALATAAAAGGEEPADPKLRTPTQWRLWQPRWRHLKLEPGWSLYARTLREAGTDPYPYALVATDAMRREQQALPLRPETLGEHVARASMASQPGALEAMLFFLPAQLVPTREVAQRIRAEARRVAPSLEAWRITEQGAQAVDLYDGPMVARRSDGVIEAQFLALATDLELTLESVRGRVDPARGTVTLERSVLIQGPPAFWGVCGTGSTPEQLAAEEAQRTKERDLVRRALRAAFDPRRTREAARALAREGVTMDAVRRALGEPDDDLGSGIHIWVYALDQGALLVGEAGKVHYMHLTPAVPGNRFPGPEGEPETLWPR